MKTIALLTLTLSLLTPLYAAAPQCKGTAKSTGAQCKKTTKDPKGFCWMHVKQATEKKVDK